MADDIYPFTSLTATVEGNLAADPKKISGSGAKSSCVVIRVAANYRNSKGDEGAIWMDVKTFGSLADNVYASYKRGDRIIAAGPVEGDLYEGKDGERMTMIMNANLFGASNRWNTAEQGEGVRAESSSRSSRSSRDDDDDEEAPRATKRRSRNDDDDDDKDEAPSRRSRRSRDTDDDDDDEDEPKAKSRSRDDDDEEDEEEAPRRRSRRSRDDD